MFADLSGPQPASFLFRPLVRLLEMFSGQLFSDAVEAYRVTWSAVPEFI
jgi:hypothetical protein